MASAIATAAASHRRPADAIWSGATRGGAGRTGETIGMRTGFATAATVAAAVVAGIGIGVVAIHALGGFDAPAPSGGGATAATVPADASAACAPALLVAERIKPLIKGDVAALVPAQAPLSVADLAFNAGDGKRFSLADYKGRAVLLNLWATWCVPCRLEMPALDRLQAELGSDRFEVVAVNIDTKDFDKPKRFLDEIAVKSLAYYADPSLGVFKQLQQRGRSRGMPTTMLIDAKGCEIATINGPAEWDRDDAKAVIRAALAP
jgi:thiol-disulfide isomerase/thioredoxin